MKLVSIYSKLKRLVFASHYSRSRKIFCIGRNKTGTTSMAKIFRKMGLSVGPQRPAELLVKDWGKNDFTRIIKYVKYSGIAFQDIPFSFPNTFKVLDKEFPDSKFILTIRDSPEIWYKSLISFHSKRFGNGCLPTKQDLKKAKYIYPGYAWEVNRLLHNTPEEDIYNKQMLIQHYIDYNDSVIKYFKNKPEQLLVVNLKEPDSLVKISKFLGISKNIGKVPWENKT
ncbi:hypothetical protein L1S33_04130 [Tenacibaculum sp. K20-16]|nr:hypothetical protein [Tenacibaculum aquimarinum]